MFEELPKKELKLGTVVLFAVRCCVDTSLLSSIHYLVLVLGGVRLNSGRSNFLMTSHFFDRSVKSRDRIVVTDGVNCRYWHTDHWMTTFPSQYCCYLDRSLRTRISIEFCVRNEQSYKKLFARSTKKAIVFVRQNWLLSGRRHLVLLIIETTELLAILPTDHSSGGYSRYEKIGLLQYEGCKTKFWH